MTTAMTNGPHVVLASQSESRRRLLTAAGVDFEVAPARVDEETVKHALHADGASALDAATALAEMKAVKVSMSQPTALVIGADQILDLNGTWFDKPDGVDRVPDHLKKLSGKTHHLATATVCARGGQRIWHTSSSPKLTMRALSDDFIAAYVEACGADVTGSVGGYHLEGRGAQLFHSVEGDYFTILGLNLLPLLGFLREHQVLPS